MFRVVDGPIDREAVRAAVEDPGFGAILIFEGVARDNFQGRPVRALEYEAYPAMAEAVMAEIGREVAERWPGSKLAIAHRTGRLAVGEASVIIAAGTPHRAACYEASRYAIDALKARVPIWKKEIYRDGARWKPNPEGGVDA